MKKTEENEKQISIVFKKTPKQIIRFTNLTSELLEKYKIIAQHLNKSDYQENSKEEAIFNQLKRLNQEEGNISIKILNDMIKSLEPKTHKIKKSKETKGNNNHKI